MHKHAASCFALSLLTLAIIPARSHAQSADPASTPAPSEKKHRFAIGADIGTTGYGPQIIFSLSRHFTVSAGYAWTDFDYAYDDEDGELGAKLDLKLKLSNASALINWHPFAGSFRISAGAYSTDNTLSAVATPTTVAADETFDIGSGSYTIAQLGTLSYAREMSNGVAPYVGIGWSKTPLKRGFYLYTEFGAIFTGASTVDISATGPVRNDTTFKADVAAEKAKQEADSLSVYPVAKIGLMYRF